MVDRGDRSYCNWFQCSSPLKDPLECAGGVAAARGDGSHVYSVATDDS